MDYPVLTNPVCSKCGGLHFGIKELNIQNANFRHYAIFCTKCGSIVCTETMQDDDRNSRIIQALNDVSNQVSRLANEINRIEIALRAKGFFV